MRKPPFGPQCGVVNTLKGGMADSTIWWLIGGVLVAAELMTGTFYLLMLAIGMASGAIGAHLGASTPWQLVVASAVGAGAVIAWHQLRPRTTQEPSAQSNPNVNLDIGEVIDVAHWDADGTAHVKYRGAQWAVVHRPGAVPSPGQHRVAEIVGSRLIVEKI